MSMYRNKLPQLNGIRCITDGGMETDLVFNHNIDLPEFAAYDLLRNKTGQDWLVDYFRIYVEIAQRYSLGLILETPTWRANREWGKRLGDSPEELALFNRAGVRIIERVRNEVATGEVPVIISGCVGPRGDGYAPGEIMSAEEAQAYHGEQIATFASTAIDMVAALTINYPSEAVGVARAAADHGLPVCISFTVETDARLPTGMSLAEAIAEVDEATNHYPAYYMINCAHPTHFGHLFEEGGGWLERIKGLRGNASCLSHAELDESASLDDGDPEAFGRQLSTLLAMSSHLTVLGGCCGTDHRHIESVGRHIYQQSSGGLNDLNRN
jgi:S-methylmethionine-dependent homocysteine/selenocysteine methylase